MMYTVGINLVGVPGITVPIEKDSSTGMPIGLQLVGNTFEEQKLFDTALSLERAIAYS